jgi:hypothetical protein
MPLERDLREEDKKKSTTSVLSTGAVQGLNQKINPSTLNHASEKLMPPKKNKIGFLAEDKVIAENASKPKLTLIEENRSKSGSRHSNQPLSDSEDNYQESVPLLKPTTLAAVGQREKTSNALNLLQRRETIKAPNIAIQSKGNNLLNAMNMKKILPHHEALKDSKYCLNFTHIQTNQLSVTEDSMYRLCLGATPFKELSATNFYFDKNNLVKKLETRLNNIESKGILHGKFVPLDPFHFECENSVGFT